VASFFTLISRVKEVGITQSVQRFATAWRARVLNPCWERDFPQPSRPFLGPTKPHIQGADKSLARPGRKQAKVSVRMAIISFGALPCRNKNLMTARVSMVLKWRASLTCFRACFLHGRAKDLSASRYKGYRGIPETKVAEARS